ncbi:MAG: 4-(cytidine 5'-diphospho)-2-C-methyl-D-erythritol kinase [Deltaproteobacteria bacterium]|nr:4-(cytidine 5'-diphospho)-2-C-methyl-D-erythritol kinase [Deltaproteobacteria bacterium]
MEEICEKSYAKLNLSLDVLSRRDDGYHDLCMVMCSVEVHDDVCLSLRSDGIITSESNLPWLPRDERNLAVRAAKAFFAESGQETLGADIRMVKRVPVGAGMAGGSANAAAVLRALNVLTGAHMSADRLREIALTVGSDVPYCVQGGVALARGRGEVLTPLPDLPECRIVICKPSFSISTADLFHRLDGRALRAHPDTSGLTEALRSGDLAGVARRMYNVFEDALPRNCAEVFSIRSELLDHGALGAIMTGTGSAVFGVFDSPDAAESAHAALAGRYRDCFLTRACRGTFI